MQIATLAGAAPAAVPRNPAAGPDILDSLSAGEHAPDSDPRTSQADQRRRRAVAEELGLTPLGAILNSERRLAPESRAFTRLEGRAAARVRNVEQRTEFRQALREVAGRDAVGEPAAGTEPESSAPTAAPLASTDSAADSAPKAAPPSQPANSSLSAPPRALRESAFPDTPPTAAPALGAAPGNSPPSGATRTPAALVNTPQPPAASAAPPAPVAPSTAIPPAVVPSPAAINAASAPAARTAVEPTAAAARPPVVGEFSARTGAAARTPTARSAAPPTERNPDANIERIVRLIHSRIGRERSVATLHLEPDTLGSIRLRMELRAASVALEVRADSELAHRLLSEHADDLRLALEASGLRLERIEFQPPATDATAGDPGPNADVRSDAGASGRRGEEPPRGEPAAAPQGEAPASAAGDRGPAVPALGTARLNVLA